MAPAVRRLPSVRRRPGPAEAIGRRPPAPVLGAMAPPRASRGPRLVPPRRLSGAPPMVVAYVATRRIADAGGCRLVAAARRAGRDGRPGPTRTWEGRQWQDAIDHRS